MEQKAVHTRNRLIIHKVLGISVRCVIKYFMIRTILTKHIGVHQGKSVKVKCQPCHKEFPDEVNLITHIYRAHSA